jgi:hypothetical protein
MHNSEIKKLLWTWKSKLERTPLLWAYLHTYVCAYVPTYLHMFVHMYIHPFICMCICTYIPLYVCAYVPTYLHMHVHNFICICVCTYLHTFICICEKWANWITLSSMRILNKRFYVYKFERALNLWLFMWAASKCALGKVLEQSWHFTLGSESGTLSTPISWSEPATKYLDQTLDQNLQ